MCTRETENKIEETKSNIFDANIAQIGNLITQERSQNKPSLPLPNGKITPIERDTMM